jgi:hypothetical protein
MSNLVSLSLGKKSKTINWGQNPTTLERGSRMQQSTSTEREERERMGQTRDRDHFLRKSEQEVVAVGRGQALVSCNLIPGKTTETKP